MGSSAENLNRICILGCPKAQKNFEYLYSPKHCLEPLGRNFLSESRPQLYLGLCTCKYLQIIFGCKSKSLGFPIN